MVGVAVVFAVAFAVVLGLTVALAFGAYTFPEVAVVTGAAVVTTSAGVPVVIGAVVAGVVPAGVGVTVRFVPGVVVHPATTRPPTSTATRASSRAVFAIN